MIYLRSTIVATLADLLNNTRLSALPYNGQLVIQAQANLGNATNNFAITIQLPSGEVPVDSQQVAAGLEADALGGQLDERYLDMWAFPATAGGHFTISLTETGTAICTTRVVLRP